MENRRDELLEYVRTLYDRKNSKASNAGMTSWAILGGIIYVIWHLLATLSSMSNEGQELIDVYFAYGQVHLTLSSIGALVSFSRRIKKQRDLDYRIFNQDVEVILPLMIMILFLGPVFHTAYEMRGTYISGDINSLQKIINFWCVSILFGVTLISLIVYSISNKLSKNSDQLPPVSTLFPNNPFSKFFFPFIVFVLIELFLGNSINIFSEILSSQDKFQTYSAAFDLSLIAFGVFILSGQKGVEKNLDRLERFERDIIIHNIPENEIIERLQDEFLGMYFGDWIEEILISIREKAENLRDQAGKVNIVIEEIDNIDKEYDKEITGRLNQYLDELSEKQSSYINLVKPLTKWLRKVSDQNIIYNDKFILSIIKSSVDEIERTDTEVSKTVTETSEKIRDWLKKS